ncbi:MAG: glycosyltransferase family 1 protein [Planctomycetota bacterium]
MACRVGLMRRRVYHGAMMLIDGRVVGPPLSGIGRYTLNLLAGIDAAPRDLLPGGRPVKVWMRPEVLRGDLVPGAVKRSDALELIESPGRPQDWVSLRNSGKALRRLGVELVHCPDVFLPWQAGCRRVVTLHDVIPLACRGQLQRSRKQRYLWAWRAWLKQQTRAAIRSGGGVVTVSEFSKRDIHRHLGVPLDHLHVIPNAIGLEGDESSSACSGGEVLEDLGVRGPFVLNVGRRDPYKNVDGLVRAFAKMRERFDDLPAGLQLVIVGPADPRYPEAEREVERLGLGDAVVFTGQADDSVLRPLYSNAALLAAPSFYEGFGLPALEAMAAGTPVVAADATSLPEVVGDAGLLYDPHRSGALAEAMRRVLVDNVLQADLRGRGLKRAGWFTVGRCGAAHLALYRKLLGKA